MQIIRDLIENLEPIDPILDDAIIEGFFQGKIDIFYEPESDEIKFRFHK